LIYAGLPAEFKHISKQRKRY